MKLTYLHAQSRFQSRYQYQQPKTQHERGLGFPKIHQKPQQQHHSEETFSNIETTPLQSQSQNHHESTDKSKVNEAISRASMSPVWSDLLVPWAVTPAEQDTDVLEQSASQEATVSANVDENLSIENIVKMYEDGIYAETKMVVHLVFDNVYVGMKFDIIWKRT
ncbi:hypothetical protein HDU76_001140 [Blyttiomyces sp. JEL0837]|nr:hypothetical protein HDU76_001140 [Blyttiomyces sp. JEL0837]